MELLHKTKIKMVYQNKFREIFYIYEMAENLSEHWGPLIRIRILRLEYHWMNFLEGPLYQKWAKQIYDDTSKITFKVFCSW